ncbi:MAG: SGNH/GDSL hydrolase family protein [Actinomycetota bacterium]
MHRTPRRTLGTVLVAFAAIVTAATAVGAAPGSSGTHAPLYYVSLGDSLAAGVQPDAAGHSVPTDEGYADQLYAAAKADIPNLTLVKLGCPGETTTTMITGGICAYDRGSQLDQAASFIRAHRRFIAFVTLDIGANDVDGCAPGGNIDVACLAAGFASTAANVPTIMSALRAAGPGVRIAGMNLYDPFLADWLSGPAGQLLAIASVPLAVDFNELLSSSFGGVPVADVQDAFLTTDFTPVPFPPFGNVPHNVVEICALTWMCAPSPVGPNIHANADGYAVIAGVFETALGL